MGIKDKLHGMFSKKETAKTAKTAKAAKEVTAPDTRNLVETVSDEVNDGITPVTVALDSIAAKEPVAEPEIEVKPATTEYAVAGDVVVEQPSAISGANPDKPDGYIETIPLGEAEEKSLAKHRYEEIKGRFSQSFLVGKYFWMMAESMDSKKPRQVVKVQRTAEIRAASLKHALMLLGWDDKNITLIRVNDDYKGEISVIVDKKPVAKITIPTEMKVGEVFVPIGKLGGGDRKKLAADIAKGAMALPEVQKVLAEKKRVVVGWKFQDRDFIRLLTDKAPKVPEQPVVFSVEQCPLPIPSADEIKEKEETQTKEDTAVFAAIEGAAAEPQMDVEIVNADALVRVEVLVEAEPVAEVASADVEA